MLLLDLGSSKLAYALELLDVGMIRLLCVAVRKNGLLLEKRRAVSYLLLSMAIHIGCWCCHRDAMRLAGITCIHDDDHRRSTTAQRPVCGQSPSKSIGRLNRT